MAALTLRADAKLDGAERGAVDAAVRAAGGTIAWHFSERVGRTYAAAEVPDAAVAAVRGAAAGFSLSEGALIALAVYPSIPEALPLLRDALAGPGRPAGVLAAEPVAGGVAIEWDPRVTSARVLFGIVDAELARFAASRTSELLAPLTPSLEAAVAADGLSTPEIAPERMLDVALERAGIHV